MDAIGHYTILEPIGAGGLGTVYRARDTRLGRTVAIKLFPESVTADAAAHEALLEDARRALRLSHPGLVTLFEMGEDAGRVYLVFEYVSGESLRSVHGDRPLNVKHAIDYAVQLAEAVAEAHRAGVVHGALRPDCIVVTGKGRVKILDMGLARWTSTGAAWQDPWRRDPADLIGSAGVLAYLSPEQALGEPFDQRADVFALGALLYEMLTGMSPFFAAQAEKTILQVVQLVPPPPSQSNPQVPREVDGIVQRALMKSPEARIKTAANLAAQLRAAAATLDRGASPGARNAASPNPIATLLPAKAIPVLLFLLVLVILAAVVWTGR